MTRIDDLRLPMRGMWGMERNTGGRVGRDASELRGRLSGLLQTICALSWMERAVRGVCDFRELA